MESFEAKKNDVLWRFYQKRFTIEKKEVEKPANFCRYFWTAMLGVCMWFRYEIKLRTIWLIVIISLFVGLYATILLVMTEDQDFYSFASVLIVALVFLLIGALFETSCRFADYLNKHVTWGSVVLAAILLVLLIAFLAYEGVLFQILNEFFDRIYPILKTSLICFISVIILSVIFFFLPQKMVQSIARIVETVIAYIVAKKQGICPPVIIPDENDLK